MFLEATCVIIDPLKRNIDMVSFIECPGVLSISDWQTNSDDELYCTMHVMVIFGKWINNKLAVYDFHNNKKTPYKIEQIKLANEDILLLNFLLSKEEKDGKIHKLLESEPYEVKIEEEKKFSSAEIETCKEKIMQVTEQNVELKQKLENLFGMLDKHNLLQKTDDMDLKQKLDSFFGLMNVKQDK